MRAAIAPIELKGLNGAVYQRLKDQLVGGRFEAGERLSLQQLADQLNVSRSPVHQALTRLAAEGLVEVRARRGYFVSPLTLETVRDAYGVRLAFEHHAAARAIGRLTRDELDRLRSLAADAAAVGAGPDALGRYIVANNRFHEYIVELARNGTMLALYQQLSVNLMMRRILGSQEFDLAALSGEHDRIIAAFEAADLELARAALSDHAEHGMRLSAAAIEKAGGAV